MAQFASAIRKLSPIEGGYSNNPSDSGGATNFGVSLRWAKSIGLDLTGDGLTTDDDIRALTRQKASELFRRYFWDCPNWRNISGLIEAEGPSMSELTDQALANRLFDMAVNMGPRRAILYLQQVLVKRFKSPIEIDGIFGLATISAANRANATRWLQAMQAVHYANIVRRNPAQEVFLEGWMYRVVS